jgi:AcrR family transcriptional regulator
METENVSRHERRRRQTRQQLIQAAVALVLEKGYEAVTIQEITDRADLGRGTFYIHFKDKEEAIWSAIQDGLRETEEETHRQYASPFPPQLEYYAYRNIFRHAERHQALYRVMLGGRGSAAMTARVQAHFAGEFRRDQAALSGGVFKEFTVPEEILAQVVTGSVIQAVRWWLETPNRYSADEMAGFLYECLHHQAPPKAEPAAPD